MMKKIFVKILKGIVRIKVYLARSMTYIAMLNSAMILIILLSNLEKYGVDLKITDYVLPMIIGTITLLMLWGFFEDKIGLWRYEQQVTVTRNPYLEKIYRTVTRMEKRQEEIEKKLKKIYK